MKVVKDLRDLKGYKGYVKIELSTKKTYVGKIEVVFRGGLTTDLKLKLCEGETCRLYQITYGIRNRFFTDDKVTIIVNLPKSLPQSGKHKDIRVWKITYKEFEGECW